MSLLKLSSAAEVNDLEKAFGISDFVGVSSGRQASMTHSVPSGQTETTAKVPLRWQHNTTLQFFEGKDSPLMLVSHCLASRPLRSEESALAKVTSRMVSTCTLL